MYIPEKRKNRQITLFDFNQSCGMELDPINEWIKLAHAIPWSKMEAKYVAMFPSKTGRPATPFRMALGVLIIQKRKKLSDRDVIKRDSGKPISAVLPWNGEIQSSSTNKAFCHCQFSQASDC